MAFIGGLLGGLIGLVAGLVTYEMVQPEPYPVRTPYVFEDCVGGWHRWYTQEGGLVVVSAGTGENCPGEEGWR